MTTREILEQEFNEKFGKLFTKEQLENLKLKNPYPQNEEIKSHIFEQMIPKVLEGIIPKELDDEDSYYYRRVVNTTINNIKQKAKENFGIDL